MAKQSKRFKCDHGIYGYEFNSRVNRTVKKRVPDTTVTVGGVAYYLGDGETDFDIDQIIWNGKDVTDLMIALDCMDDFKRTAEKEAEELFANESASEDEPENIFEMIANYTQV